MVKTGLASACQRPSPPPSSPDGAIDARRFRPAERVDPDLRQRRAEAARPRRSCRCSIPASCSATASGRGCASTRAGIAFLDRHLDRLFEGAKAIAMDIGLDRDELIARGSTRRSTPTAWTDGVHIRLMVTRGVRATPYQDPRVIVGGATIVIIPEYKAAAPKASRARAEAVHRARPPRRSRRAGPEAQLASQAQLHHRLHPGGAGGRRRSADARPARLRRDLQLDPLLHRPQGRGVDLDAANIASAASRAGNVSSSAARTASRCSRRISR